MSIKELGISRNVYLGDIEAYDNHYAHNNDDTKRVTIALSLPTDTATGSYTVEIEAYNSELNDKETREIVVEKELGKSIEIIPQITEATLGTGATAQYSLLVSNTGETDEHFVVEVLGANGWATTVISPASFNLGAGESKIVQIDLTAAKDAEAGRYPFTVRVRYGNEAKQYNLMANVTKGVAVDWKIILMIIGIVLAVAIIVLLIITLIKQNKGSFEEKPELESYY
ncbi:MAG: NEW3 domain-containing protein [Candidatus Pacearchaeota archaeon]